jgi:hypothetical protein
MKYDLPYKISALDGAIKDKRKLEVYQKYISKINAFASNNNYGDSFEDSDRWIDNGKNINMLDTTDEGDYDGVEIEYLKNKWGTELPLSDLMWLEQKYTEWYDNYDIQGKAMDLLVQQLCFEELFVYKERQTGEDVSKRLKSIQEMLKNSKLSPRQETASEQAEFQSISEFIKKAEQQKPFVKTNPEFNDPDKFRNMWQSMAGAITRTAGRPDENTKVFEEYFKDSTMDLSNLLSKDGEK